MGASVTGCAAAGPGRLGEAQPENGVELDAVGCDATLAVPVVGRNRVELTPVDAPAPQPLNWINAPGRVFVTRHGRSELTTTILHEGQVRDLVEKMLKATGRRVDLSTPFVDATIPCHPVNGASP